MNTRKRKCRTNKTPIKKLKNQVSAQNSTSNSKQITENDRLSDTELQLMASNKNDGYSYGTPLLFCMMELDKSDIDNPNLIFTKNTQPTNEHKKETTSHLKALKVLAEKKLIPNEDNDVKSIKETYLDLA